MAYSWRNHPDLIARLTTAQNHPSNSNIDIMSYAGWCESREELEKHVERYEAKVEQARLEQRDKLRKQRKQRKAA